MRAGFETWLALLDTDYIRVYLRPDEPAVFGLADDRGAALVLPEGDLCEVEVYGDGGRLAVRLIEAYAEWDQRRPRPQELRIVAFRTEPGGYPPRVSGDRTFRRRWFTFAVSWR